MNDPQAQARAAIRPVKEAVEQQLIEQPNVVGVDIGDKETDGKNTGKLSIIVFVDEKKPLAKVPKSQRIPSEIDGIPTDVQELTIELQTVSARLAVEDSFSPFVDAAAYPALEGGISIGPLRSVHLDPPDVPASGNYVFVGTLGAMVRDRATGATMALTNFHVACINNTWSVGDRQVQQSLVDGGTAAGQFGSLTRATLSDQVDGAVITVDAAKTWTATVHDVGAVAGALAATVGMAVQKRGRTTEHTFGSVASTDFTVSINYGSNVGTRVLHHQIRINTDTSRSARFSDHGDSGSVVLTDDRHVVGLLFAGSSDGSMTFANPIASVLGELGVDLLTGPVIVKTKPILTCLSSKLDTICGGVTKYVDMCGLKTKYVGPCGLRTRTVVCGPVRSKFTVCITKGSPICDDLPVASKPPCIPDLFSRACGGGRPPIDWGGGFGGFGDHESVYGGSDSSVDEAYLAGYLAALEEVAEADASDDGREG